MLFASATTGRCSQQPEKLWQMGAAKSPILTKINGLIQCRTSGVHGKSTAHTFIWLLLWKGILLLTRNRWIAAFQVLSLLHEIALPLQLPSGVLQLLTSDSLLGRQRPSWRAVQEHNPPSNSLKQKMPEKLSSFEKLGGKVPWKQVQCLGALVPKPTELDQPQYWMLSCVLPGIIPPQPPFIDCSSASASGFTLRCLR